MEEIRSIPEVPAIAHFCSLFRESFTLLDFNIEQLEEALLTDGTETGGTLLQDLIVHLLIGCIPNHPDGITSQNYQMCLRTLFQEKCQAAGRANPFNTNIDFQLLPVRVKVEIIHVLCDFRLDALDVNERLKPMDADSLRVEPLGYDCNRSAYWYFYGSRLYREDFPNAKKRLSEQRSKRRESKRTAKLQDSTESGSDYETEQKGDGVWQVECLVGSDWHNLVERLRDSSYTCEQNLHHIIVSNFLHTLPDLNDDVDDSELQEDSQTRRQSSRLENKSKACQKMDSCDNDNGDSGGGTRRLRERNRASPAPLWDDTGTDADDDVALAISNGKAKPAGRQTNNSLCSATGQIFIQAPKQKRLKSKQVYKTTSEDLRTGMYKILDFVKGHEDAWPFRKAVDAKDAPGYYSVIRQPMHLGIMEDKLDNGDYDGDWTHFRSDFQLIVDNCRQYNGSENEYTDSALSLLEVFNAAVDRVLESDSSSDEGVQVVVEQPKLRERKVINSRHSKKRTKKNIKTKAKEKQVVEDEDKVSPPLTRGVRSRSTGSDGSVPGSDFDVRDPDFLREKSPRHMDKDHSDCDVPSSKKRRLKIEHTYVDIDALNAAGEDTLKSICILLEDVMPPQPFSGGSSGNVTPNHQEDYQFPKVPHKPLRNSRDPVRRRKPLDLLRPMKRKDIRTIDRLQPGKSKGNLIVSMPKSKDFTDDVCLGLSMGKSGKEGRNALLVKTDDAGPKLSLGTVLTSDILDFGKNKHSFDVVATLEVSILPPTSTACDSVEEEESIRSPIPFKDESKEEELITNKENDPVGEQQVENVLIKEEKKRDGVKEITNKPAPNASAWFKAFGAPKAPATTKKKTETLENIPVSDEKESSGWGGTTMSSVAPRRQRKVSSSSSVSEPSSLSQDSPLHPVSPGLVSPRGEPPIPAINTPVRKGFYQDMSSLHKSSPDKQSPCSTHSSPRELSNQSPFHAYSHVYPPSSPGTYTYANPASVPPSMCMATTQPQLSPHSPHSPTAPFYDTLPQYPYADQYRQPQPHPTIPVDSTMKSEPKPNLSCFPMKKRLYANVEAPNVLEPKKDLVPQLVQTDLAVSRAFDESDKYLGDYQQRPMNHFNPNPHDTNLMSMQRLHQPSVDPSGIVTSQPDLSRLAMPSEMPRSLPSQSSTPHYHDLINSDSKPKYALPDPGLSAMMENFSRIGSQTRPYQSPLERLMPQSMNGIQEDSDGVFRNKYSADGGYSSHSNNTVSPAYSAPGMPHMVDRFEDNRLLSNHYYDKEMYLKNATPPTSMPMYQNAMVNGQNGYELNIPKPRETKPVQKKKRATKKAEPMPTSTGFQHYASLKPTEPSVQPIALKSTSAVPGSAFNFGPGLNNPIYSEGYLDELRQPTYYGMVGGEKTPFLTPPARSGYAMSQFMNPGLSQPGLVDHFQHIRRVQEEQLRLAYPPGYHHALSMRPTYDRSAWM